LIFLDAPLNLKADGPKPVEGGPSPLKEMRWVMTVDHKNRLMYITTSLVFFIVGGIGSSSAN
jgi:hypothetical protein